MVSLNFDDAIIFGYNWQSSRNITHEIMTSSQRHKTKKDSSVVLYQASYKLTQVASNDLSSQYHFSSKIRDLKISVEWIAKKFKIVKAYFSIVGVRDSACCL